MAEMLDDLDAPTDAELISRVRGGETDAYGELFARHVEAARRLARQLVRGPDSEDLVSEAFTKVMGALQSGGGPDIAFRAYLLTAVRRLHVDRIRAQARLTTSDDLTEFDPGVPFQDTVVERFESGAAARAFASLPERWQMVLWHLEVERQKPADVAPLLGMTANSVSALAYRAREGLRQAFLAAHLAEIDDADCAWVVEHLGGYVRKGLPRREVGKLESHLETCRSCSGMHLELVEVNNDLSGVIAPLLLGGLAAAYLGATGTGIAGGGVVALLDRAKDFVAGHLVPVGAGATTAGVAAAVVIAGSVGGGARATDPPLSSEPPSSQVTNVEAADDLEPRRPATISERPKPRRPGPADPTGDPATGTDTTTSQGPSEDRPTAPSQQRSPQSAAPSPSATSAPPGADVGGRDEQPGDGKQDPDAPEKDTDTGPTKPTEPPPSPSEPPAEHDIALRLDGNMISKGIGRFRAHVTGLPTASGPNVLQLRVAFSDDRVRLESIPHQCTSSGSGSVSCTGNGATFNGQFDADMAALAAGESVTITVTVSLADAPDPDPGDNTRALTLTRTKAKGVLAND